MNLIITLSYGFNQNVCISIHDLVYKGIKAVLVNNKTNETKVFFSIFPFCLFRINSVTRATEISTSVIIR